MVINPHSWQTLITNIHIATMAEGSASYGTIMNAALAIAEGKIAWFGELSDLPKFNSNTVTVVDGAGAWLTPGLIDCHTHLVFGGNRANEFELRLQGASYQEIANKGGGIVSTVKATRSATEQELLDSAFNRLLTLHNEGVTSVEIKSGYGLDIETEEKMLKVAAQLATKLPVTIQKTFLGAHALPIEYSGRADDYINHICTEMLPTLVSKNLVDVVDVFCENIGFNLAQTKRVFDSARSLNIPVKLHAEQLSDIGGSELAANYNALSCDHLEYLSEQSIKAMKASNTVAVLLPGAFYFLRETKLPPLDLLRQYNIPIAVATDCNPGSSPISSLQLMLNMACTLFRLTPIEALAGVTCNAAQALGLDKQVGTICIGKNADLALWNISQPAELCYQFGVNPLKSLYKNGNQVI